MLHCTQVSSEIAEASVASRHAPPSTCTSTFEIPTCCCQATPAITVSPALSPWPRSGTSIRDCSLIGPFSDQPRSVQYACAWSNLVTSSSTTHLVADTYPY